ncbi:tripartite tricarboxylate transporter substrate binding protein [Bordetella sp. BOR01]|uniref:tripartite tricarboxylate transporter substrate binding protein n=1 Tax=Bordetella sp. BOR01 TaxID=2854779 RepID=UPI001C46DF1E|nr:tripartite tricarboxylate transporter substrate binding protein [Bordetella sp. BOR01]MBV7483301.1 tripartite tricarboxylate transporter substrate binding protein [Bordetella sp. BOR01]
MGKTLGSVMLVCAGMLSQTAMAAWPDDKPIELVVGFAPGGGTDVMARNLARFMEKRLGESARIVVVNKPGSGGEIAANYIQHAKPDGYTLGMINVPGYIFLPMYRKTSYQPDQIRLIARIVDDPAMLVANRDAGKPVTLQDFIAQSKQTAFSVGHSGDGTTGHLGMLELGRDAGFQFTSIPFKGNGEAKASLLGQHVDYVMMTTGEALEVGQPGTPLVGVALWGAKRAANGVPTLAEQGYNLQISSERGIGGPLNLPDDIAKRVQDAVQATMKDPEFLKAGKADAPVLAFLPGAQWNQQLQELGKRMKALVDLMGSAK